MTTRKKLTRNAYIAINIVIALMFFNTLLFGPALRAGESFTWGLVTGLGAGWLVFAVAGAIELRRPGRVMDERQASIYGKSASLAFGVMILAASVLQVLLRAETLHLALDAKDSLAIVADSGLVTLGASWLILSRRG